MIDQIAIDTIVVIRNFLNNCGLLGAPGSSPSIPLVASLFLILIGRDRKNINHQIKRNIIIDPVIPNF